MKKFCTNCGANIKEGAKFCMNCGTSLDGKEETKKTTSAVNEIPTAQGKSKVVAGLLAIFVGMFGVHNFYLGYTGKGIAQLLLTLLSCFVLSFVSGIWSFIEGILILTGEIKKDAYGVDLRD